MFLRLLLGKEEHGRWESCRARAHCCHQAVAISVSLPSFCLAVIPGLSWWAGESGLYPVPSGLHQHEATLPCSSALPSFQAGRNLAATSFPVTQLEMSLRADTGGLQTLGMIFPPRFSSFPPCSICLKMRYVSFSSICVVLPRKTY